jgi:pumilio homology domain family member 6
MVHTRDGSRLVREFIKRGNAKDRKQLLSKTLKPHLAKMVQDEEAQMVIFEAVRRVEYVIQSLDASATSADPSLYCDSLATPSFY